MIQTDTWTKILEERTDSIALGCFQRARKTAIRDAHFHPAGAAEARRPPHESPANEPVQNAQLR